MKVFVSVGVQTSPTTDATQHTGETKQDVFGSTLEKKKPYLTYQRPSGSGSSLAPSKEVNRAVSLPSDIESIPSASNFLNCLLENNRNVSMPASFKGFSSFPCASQQNSRKLLSPFSVNSPENSLALGSSGSLDLPATPSPPSSPDSVEIISGRNQIIDPFIRNKNRYEIDDRDGDKIFYPAAALLIIHLQTGLLGVLLPQNLSLHCMDLHLCHTLDALRK